WLYNAWLKWNEERPELLNRLTEHSFELNQLITPAAFPNQHETRNRTRQSRLINMWQENGQSNPSGLQLQLLGASNSARFPHAFILKQVLEIEQRSSSVLMTQSWRTAWDSFLQAEMTRGRNAT